MIRTWAFNRKRQWKSKTRKEHIIYITKRRGSDVRNRYSRGGEAMAEKDGVVGERPTLHT